MVKLTKNQTSKSNIVPNIANSDNVPNSTNSVIVANTTNSKPSQNLTMYQTVEKLDNVPNLLKILHCTKPLQRQTLYQT